MVLFAVRRKNISVSRNNFDRSKPPYETTEDHIAALTVMRLYAGRYVTTKQVKTLLDNAGLASTDAAAMLDRAKGIAKMHKERDAKNGTRFDLDMYEKAVQAGMENELFQKQQAIISHGSSASLPKNIAPNKVPSEKHVIINNENNTVSKTKTHNKVIQDSKSIFYFYCIFTVIVGSPIIGGFVGKYFEFNFIGIILCAIVFAIIGYNILFRIFDYLDKNPNKQLNAEVKTGKNKNNDSEVPYTLYLEKKLEHETLKQKILEQKIEMYKIIVEKICESNKARAVQVDSIVNYDISGISPRLGLVFSHKTGTYINLDEVHEIRKKLLSEEEQRHDNFVKNILAKIDDQSNNELFQGAHT